MTETFYVSSSDSEYLEVDVRETTEKDISDDVVELSIGSANHAGDWVLPDLVRQTNNSQITFGLKLNDDMPKGLLYLWIRIHDLPEVIVRRVAAIILM